MAETRRKFDQDFKEGAVRLVRETGKPVAQVARDLGINEGTLGTWVNADRRRRGDGTGALSEDERAELVRLRRENAELAMERCPQALRRPLGTRGDGAVAVAAQDEQVALPWIGERIVAPPPVPVLRSAAVEFEARHACCCSSWPPRARDSQAISWQAPQAHSCQRCRLPDAGHPGALRADRADHAGRHGHTLGRHRPATQLYRYSQHARPVAHCRYG